MEFKFGAKVVNKLNQEGILLKEEERRLVADFSGKIMKFPSNAFQMGFLSYLDSSSQEEITAAREEAAKKEEERLAKVKEAEEAAIEKAKSDISLPSKKKTGSRSSRAVLYGGYDESSKHNVILLRHQPVMNVRFDNPFYLNQCSCLKDYLVFDVTSRCLQDKAFMEKHPSFAKDLSPFFIGPLTSSDGKECKIFELFWQCSKVFPGFDDHGVPNEDYFKWRDSYYSLSSLKDHKELRRPWAKLGYSARDTLYEAYFDKGTKKWLALGYIESRKKIYFREYAKLVYNSPSFLWLKSLLKEGKKIALVDFDAFNFYSDQAKEKLYESYLRKCKGGQANARLTLADFLNVKTMKDVVNFPLPAGHAVVLKALLNGDLEVDSAGEVIDRSGILD